MAENIWFTKECVCMKDEDYTQAKVYLEKALKEGCTDAFCELGTIYASGTGVGKDTEKALFWWEQTTSKGNAEAYGELGDWYSGGILKGNDSEKSLGYYQRGVELDNVKAANCGHAYSQKSLGEMYMLGVGVEQDYTKAVYWFKTTCEKGERDAFYYLGECYRNGLGVEKNVETAFELYREGAETGSLQSKVTLAQCLIEGWETSCDETKAFLVSEGICHYEEECRERLVTMVTNERENGLVDFINPLDEQKQKYYEKAYYLLALLYYSGCGTKKNASEAIRLLHIAEKLNSENEGDSNEPITVLLNKIIEQSAQVDNRDTTDCYVEVREVKKTGERYDVVIHHADGTETVVDFKGRNKFFYVLTLLTAYNRSAVCGVTTKHFSYMHDVLCRMAYDFRIKKESYEKWIDEFIYKEREEDIGARKKRSDGKVICNCQLCRDKYSNAFSGANRAIKKCCTNEEYETLKLRNISFKPAVTTVSVNQSQIVLPDSLMIYLDALPTSNDIINHKLTAAKWIPLEG